jgi:hypothetical protein
MSVAGFECTITKTIWFSIQSENTFIIYDVDEYIRGSLKVAPITEKLKGNRLSWYGHVMRREDNHVTRRVMNMNVEGWRGRGRPIKYRLTV